MSVAEPASGNEPRYRIADGLCLAAQTRPYERKPSDPVERPLRIYALDPGASVLDGAVATIGVPYEPLTRSDDRHNLRGSVFEVDPLDPPAGNTYAPLDLNDPRVLLDSGRAPSPLDPRFHQQMVYAVCSIVYRSFRIALGRHPTWAFAPGQHREASYPGQPGTTRLLLCPFGADERNAYYDKDRGALVFGYFAAPRDAPGTPTSGYVFTSLSHDVITHEVTHALLDGLRSNFTEPSNPDVAAFHEGFADLIAMFHRFTYPEIVRAGIGASSGRVGEASLLFDIAVQFGRTLTGRPLRSPIERPEDGPPRRYDPTLEAHALGNVLVSAVFSAFVTVFERKTKRYWRLASHGSGVLPRGEIPDELVQILADEAADLANQFLKMCIRAIDYCPPVDITFGEFLRAVITADAQLVHDDRWHYREAWIDAFRARGIFPRGVRFLSQDALLWQGPLATVPRIDGLAFSKLQFDGDPARPADAGEMQRQAYVLGEFITTAGNTGSLGLTRTDDPRLGGDTVDPPVIQSMRTARRSSPEGRIVFDLVAEVTQARHVRRSGTEMCFLGGSTLIVGPEGEVRFAISKSVLNEPRINDQLGFANSEEGRALWERRGGRLQGRRDMLRALHGRRYRS